MVEHLDSSGCAPTEDEIAFVTAYLAEGFMDSVLLARAADPARVAARAEAGVRQRERDWPNLGQYRSANAAQRAPVRAVFMGDSLTEFWPVADPGLFGGGVVGRGISGQTSPQILLRFMPDVVALRPRCVHLLAGVNDVAGNTGPSTPQDYRNNMLAMIALAQANGIAVILGGLPAIEAFGWAPQLRPRARLLDLDAWLRATARDRGLVFADYAAVLCGPDGIRPEFTRDGIHPTAHGYAAMRPVADAALASALQD